MEKMKEMEIVINSIKYKLSLELDGNELFFKMESVHPRIVYINHFSYEHLKDISEVFSMKKDLRNCKKLINTFINNKQYKIETKDELLIFHFDCEVFKFDIKLSLKKETLNLNYNCLSMGIKTKIDKNELILGIDFGTTYSTASIVIDNEPIIIPNDFGNLQTPSYISFSDDKNYYAGELAKLTPSFDKNTIYGIKRLIGRKYNDNYYDKTIEEIKKDQDFPFEIIKDVQSDKIKIIINYEVGEKKFKKEFFPEQLCAILLKKIKNDSEYYLSQQIGKNIVINNAVITVPAYFNQRQREAIKQSAQIINLNVKRIINEPTAACLSFGYEKQANEKGKYILVIDFGGGTLDITILYFTKNEKNIICDIKTSFGHSNLGGDDFDLELMKFFLNEKGLKDTKNMSKNIRLKRACEKVKIELSDEMETEIKLEDYQNSIDINIPIKRDKFNEICTELFNVFEKQLDKILQENVGIKPDISKIVLIGGSTFIPKIRDIISKKFPKIDINQSKIDTLFAVSKGAAILAAKESGLNIKKIYLSDVTNLPLGVEILGQKMSQVVKKNTEIPFEEEKTFQTVKDNQTICDIRIYEGEKEEVKDNFNLGNFSIKNLPEKPAGEAKIKLNFYVDEDSCLNVQAFDLSNDNHHEKLKIEKPKLFRDEEIEKLKNEEINMKDMKELMFEDYDKYKYDIIQIQEKINQSENVKKNLLDLIDKLYYLLKKPYESLKIYFSFAKYYFYIINEYIEISKQKNIEIDNNIIQKIESSIGDIFDNIQFYDNNEKFNNIFSNKANYNNILRETIDDLVINVQLYDFCLNKLIFHYIEKVKAILYSLNLRENIEKESKIIDIIKKSSCYLDEAKKILTQMSNNNAQINTFNQKNNNSYNRESSDSEESSETNISPSCNYGKMIEDLNILIKVKKLRFNIINSFSVLDIVEIYPKYEGNSFDMLKNQKDLEFLSNLLPMNKEENRIQKCIIKLDKELKEIEEKKEVDLSFVVDDLFYIMDNIRPFNSLENLCDLRDKFCGIKGYFDSYTIQKYRKEFKEKAFEILAPLRAYYNGVKQTKLIVKVCIYLNKLIRLIDKI